MQQEVKLIVATDEHYAELAFFNKCLIDDGGCNNDMSLQELECRMREFISSEDYVLVIFEVGNKHIGYTLINKNKMPMFIRHYFIAKEFRRKGYGSSAFAKLVDYLKVDKIDLSVLAHNEIGFKFWQRCGFTPYETIMHFRMN